jgi:nitrogen fixation NifU-like protein
MDHYKHPRHHGTLEDADIHVKDHNPMCGDVIEWYGTVADNTFATLRFNGEGCAISQATASLVADHYHDDDFDTIMDVDKDDILDLLGTRLTVSRVKCAMLGIKTLQQGIKDWNNADN